MAGIYIHIPFCKQACHYCDFHFSTSLKKKEELLNMLKKELILRKEELSGESVETIYFGGGTPSVLKQEEIDSIIQTVFDNYLVISDPEITLEANPDDLSVGVIDALKSSRVNRLSIGVQSFHQEDLEMMNRAHTAEEAWNSLLYASEHFDNISVDLIYGIPGLAEERWLYNIEKVLQLGISHISSYALTVERQTALYKLIEKGKIPQPDDGIAHTHFMMLIERLQQEGFIHYELSNFSKPGFFSKNNSAYWLGKSYLGIGPSAHSFNGVSRSWNISNNALYIKSLEEGVLPSESEKLTVGDRYNEYVMTGLRTIWGVDVERISKEFGVEFKEHILKMSHRFIEKKLMLFSNGVLTITNDGKFLSDGIASDLFWLDLK
ncbi:radical SAM family heme chaperone HemW [Myroides guanonis]|uniref:Heme chaperone HemW n=1 Tax=Myroides guanonis TaxID=1150112 RepID=A0A1I3SFA4_9FLAO|nr:radical SAM family heme chaperone HemW [Myroides guanonis]SFJ56662.1 oxygen-independent coproporphyrinogen-3 oxidase [Myroides guanonis]